MNCPVCNRNLVPNLSICPSCGTMMNDSVREELKNKIAPVIKPVKFEIRGDDSVSNKANQVYKPKRLTPQEKSFSEKSLKTPTTEIFAKPTNPTLVEFQNKNAALPEWRLQLQNAVKKRKNGTNSQASENTVSAKFSPLLATNGSVALKKEAIEEENFVTERDKRLKNALRRIEDSRRKFLVEEKTENLPKHISSPSPTRNYPFYIAPKNAEILTGSAEKPAATNETVASNPKASCLPPSLIRNRAATNETVTSNPKELPVIEKKGYDTNRLRPLPDSAVISSNTVKASAEENPKTTKKEDPFVIVSDAGSEIEEKAEEKIGEFTVETEEAEETLELAPLSMRFNAGLFDLIIGSFTSLILLAPLMISGGNWFSFAGFLAYLVTCAIVMFIYLTTAVGFFGQTFGMKIFSLEIIDIEEDEYPTLHQAAVNSSVYLLSLFLGGIGFIPALFNEEKRAAHDLLSGTIVVKEY